MRNNPLVLIRDIKVKKLWHQMQKAIKRLFDRQVKESATRARKGLTPLPVDYQTRWASDLYDVEYSRLTFVMAEGYDQATEELGMKSIKLVGTEPSSFILEGTRQDLENRLKDPELGVSKVTKTNATKIQKVYDQAYNYVDPTTGQGRSAAWIAKQIKKLDPVYTAQRAKMIAVTETNWAFNHGTMANYQSIGVEVLEWLTAKDDRVCAACTAMDGIKVKTGRAFLESGETIENYTTSTPIQHPPLHPYCACTLLPVLEAASVVVDQPTVSTQPVKPAAPAPLPPASVAEPVIVSEQVAPAVTGEIIPAEFAAYTPKETLKEAVDWAELHYVKEVKDSAGRQWQSWGKKWKTEEEKLKNMNSMNLGFSDLREKFPNMKVDIDILYNTSSSGGMANIGRWKELHPDVKLKLTSMNDFSEALIDRIKKQESVLGYRVYADESYNEMVRSSMRHELAHHLTLEKHIAAIGDMAANNQWLWGKKWTQENISQYAATNHKETIAEALVKYTNPSYKIATLPRGIEEIIEDMLGVK